MMTMRLFLSVLATLAFGCAAPAAEQKTIRIATEGAFPPWNAIDITGKPIGFDIDVGQALCERAALTCTFITQAWDGIIPGLAVGKYDAVMAGMSITDKRKQVIAFSEPYALTSNYFAVLKSAGLPPLDANAAIDLTPGASNAEASNTVLGQLKAALRGKIIGVQGSTNAEAFVRQYFGADVQVRTYDKQDNLNLDLKVGRIDAGLADFPVWSAFLGTKEGSNATLYGPRISGGIFGPGVGIGLRKDEGDLKVKFNAAIKSMLSDGSLKAISLKWFGSDLVTP